MAKAQIPQFATDLVTPATAPSPLKIDYLPLPSIHGPRFLYINPYITVNLSSSSPDLLQYQASPPPTETSSFFSHSSEIAAPASETPTVTKPSPPMPTYWPQNASPFIKSSPLLRNMGQQKKSSSADDVSEICSTLSSTASRQSLSLPLNRDTHHQSPVSESESFFSPSEGSAYISAPQYPAPMHTWGFPISRTWSEEPPGSLFYGFGSSGLEVANLDLGFTTPKLSILENLYGLRTQRSVQFNDLILSQRSKNAMMIKCASSSSAVGPDSSTNLGDGLNESQLSERQNTHVLNLFEVESLLTILGGTTSIMEFGLKLGEFQVNVTRWLSQQSAPPKPPVPALATAQKQLSVKNQNFHLLWPSRNHHLPPVEFLDIVADKGLKTLQSSRNDSLFCKFITSQKLFWADRTTSDIPRISLLLSVQSVLSLVLSYSISELLRLGECDCAYILKSSATLEQYDNLSLGGGFNSLSLIFTSCFQNKVTNFMGVYFLVAALLQLHH